MTSPHRFDLDAIGAGLPVAEARAELEAAARTGAMVVTAPPGTGKTTLVPPLVANLAEGLTLVTQPRRVAVRAAARRVAGLDGTELGGPVGFTVRGQRQVGRSTRLEMITPGVLLRRLLADPALPGVSAVVLDEVHERSLETDLLLGMLAEVRQLREDLLVGAMSATLDAGAVSALLDGAPIVDVPSALHPLDGGLRPLRPPPASMPAASPASTSTISPGPRPVPSGRRAATPWCSCPGPARSTRSSPACRGWWAAWPEAATEPAAAREPAARTSRCSPSTAVSPPPSRTGRPAGAGPARVPRIVVSTSIAESSLTVPGVHLVVDARAVPRGATGSRPGHVGPGHGQRLARRGGLSAPAAPRVRVLAGRCGCSRPRISPGCPPSRPRTSRASTSPTRPCGSPAGEPRGARAWPCSHPLPAPRSPPPTGPCAPCPWSTTRACPRSPGPAWRACRSGCARPAPSSTAPADCPAVTVPAAPRRSSPPSPTIIVPSAPICPVCCRISAPAGRPGTERWARERTAWPASPATPSAARLSGRGA